jgi:predicted dehydrogenase
MNIAIVGCGLMGKRHIHGLKELIRNNLADITLTAVVDSDRARAEEAARLSKELLGYTPRTYGDLHSMINDTRPDIADIATDVKTHHTIATSLIQHGVNCLVEKPLAITVQACNAIMEESRKHKVKVAVAENYRRDPCNRLTKSLIRSEVLGKPLHMLQLSVGGGDNMMLSTWRHKKSGVISLDMGVHYTDLIYYFLGLPKTVVGTASIIRSFRYKREMVNNKATKSVTVECETEDFLDALYSYEGRTSAKLYLNSGAAGQGLWYRIVYCEDGSIMVPMDRTGEKVKAIRAHDADYLGLNTGQIWLGAPYNEEESEKMIEAVLDETYDDHTKTLFPKVRNGYRMGFEEVDKKLIALELLDFIDSVRDNRRPETDAYDGMIAVALIYSALESSLSGEAVKLNDIMNMKIQDYQNQINMELARS